MLIKEINDSTKDVTQIEEGLNVSGMTSELLKQRLTDEIKAYKTLHVDMPLTLKDVQKQKDRIIRRVSTVKNTVDNIVDILKEMDHRGIL